MVNTYRFNVILEIIQVFVPHWQCLNSQAYPILNKSIILNTLWIVHLLCYLLAVFITWGITTYNYQFLQYTLNVNWLVFVIYWCLY